MNIGIVGTGWVAEKHLAALTSLPGVRIAGIAGRNTDRARDLARTAAAFGDEPRVWGDGLALVKAGGLDAVVVLLPPHLHGPLEFEIARRVPAALIEKPVSHDLRTAEAVAEAFERAGTLVSVGYMNRYRATTQRLRTLFSAPGDEPITVSGWWVTPMPSPRWWRTKEQSGGQFVEQCTHLVDLARDIVGEVTEVSAFSARGFIQGVDGFTGDDALAVNLRFSTGALGQFLTGCFPRGEGTTGNRPGIGLSFASRTTQATLTDWEMHLSWKNHVGDGEELKSTENIFQVQDRAFVGSLRGPNQIRSSYADGLKTLRVTLAAEESAATGRPVRLSGGLLDESRDPSG